MTITATTPTGLVRAAVEQQEKSVFALSEAAGLNRMSLYMVLKRDNMHAESAALWLGRILGGDWAIAVSPGWAVGMPAAEMRAALSQ